jgi:hypothetical protein
MRSATEHPPSLTRELRGLHHPLFGDPELDYEASDMQAIRQAELTTLTVAELALPTRPRL